MPARGARGSPRSTSGSGRRSLTAARGWPCCRDRGGCRGEIGCGEDVDLPRHADRGALLTAALSDAIGEPQVPREGTVREKIRFALEQAWRQMGEVLGPGGWRRSWPTQIPSSLSPSVLRCAVRPIAGEADPQRLRRRRLASGLDADGIVSLMFDAYLASSCAVTRLSRLARSAHGDAGHLMVRD